VRSRVASAEHGDLVAQDEQLSVLRRRCAAEQCQPAEEPNEDQVEQAERHVRDHAEAWNAHRCRSQPQADFWNPTGSDLLGHDLVEVPYAAVCTVHDDRIVTWRVYRASWR
jgi:hypothetical protein